MASKPPVFIAVRTVSQRQADTIAYGVTTIPDRRDNLFKDTLSSLIKAGFTNPHIFVDGGAPDAYKELPFPKTFHSQVGCYGNWILSLWELFLQNKTADWYLLFQDDVECVAGLHTYLSQCKYPKGKNFFNLYSFPQNEELVSEHTRGWFKSNQRVRGALGLMFNRDALTALLSHSVTVTRPLAAQNSHKGVDTVICESLIDQLGYTEYCHNPSLLQHAGHNHSTLRYQTPDAWLSNTFPGQSYNVIKLLTPTEMPTEPWTIQDCIDNLTIREAEELPAPEYDTGPATFGPNIALATEWMRTSTTDEGWQIMESLQSQGYILAGANLLYGTHVPSIVDELQPQIVLVQDKREWHKRDSKKDFRPDGIEFIRTEYLKNRPEIFKLTILKDAQHETEYHRNAADEIDCHAWIVYYHPTIIKFLAPYVRTEHLIRTYHSLDKNLIPQFDLYERGRCLLSGAISDAYPLRKQLMTALSILPETDYLKHPGYKLNDWIVPKYLDLLSHYKVAICTASRYGYALRKIIEATACGCRVITDLPVDEVLPEIDGNLIRVHPQTPIRFFPEIIQKAIKNYNPSTQQDYAERAQLQYDWRESGRRLAKDIDTLRKNYNAASTVVVKDQSLQSVG